jgi:hypothetical protein
METLEKRRKTKRKKSVIVAFRVSESVKNKLQELAKNESLNLSKYLINKLLTIEHV